MVKYSRAEVLCFILFPLVLEFKDVSFEIGSYSFTTKLLFSHIILRDPTEKQKAWNSNIKYSLLVEKAQRVSALDSLCFNNNMINLDFKDKYILILLVNKSFVVVMFEKPFLHTKWNKWTCIISVLVFENCLTIDL